jgi:hypothetical protein
VAAKFQRLQINFLKLKVMNFNPEVECVWTPVGFDYGGDFCVGDGLSRGIDSRGG